MELRLSDGVSYLAFPELSALGVVSHAFTTRLGGVSVGPFATLNMGYHVGDDPACVEENRKRALRAVEAPSNSLVAGVQVHGSHTAVVGPNDRGCEWAPGSPGIPATDCLVTSYPGVVLSCYVADCVPIFLVHREGRGIGLVHAGWRGVALNAPGQAVAMLCEAFGLKPGDILAGIGPSIGSCCYEVGREVAVACHTAARSADVALPAGRGKFRLDLKEACRKELLIAGLARDNILVSTLCTSCREDLFFSYRGASGTTGRMAALMFIPE